MESDLKKFLNDPKVSKESKFLVQFMEKYVTEAICLKIDKKDKEIQRLSSEVSDMKKEIDVLKEANIIQKYELDELRFASNKDFVVLNGPGVPKKSSETAQKIIKKTIQAKTGISIDIKDITEATKIPIKNRENSEESLILRFKIPSETRTEVTKKLASLRPNIYLNEASSPLKRALLSKIRVVKSALAGKIKSAFIKNGTILLYEEGSKSAISIPHEIAWEKYLKKINFSHHDSESESDSDQPEDTV